MRYGSVCSGIEAASVAWEPLGFKAQFLSEIDTFPCAVLKHRFPNVPLHGDFMTIQRGEYGAVDILVGGTPCQSFSVAGLRAGLDDPRGNLMLGFGSLAERLAPKWLVWENVPGVLSSNGGRDFGTFLGMLAQLGYGFAYRVLDAQYIRVESHPRAVPQRRRRVFVVGYFGDWRPAAAVLFERESLQGYPAPRREAGQRISDSLTVGANQCSGRPGDFAEHSVSGPIGSHHSCRQDLDSSGAFVPTYSLHGGGKTSQNSHGSGCNEDVSFTVNALDVHGVCHTLRSEHDASEDGTGRGTPLVAQTITSDMYRSGCATAGNNPGVRNVLAFAFNGDQSEKTRSMGEPEECTPTIRSDGPCHVAFCQNQRNEVREMEVAGAIPAIRRGDAKNETLVKQVQWASGGGKIENDTAQAIRSGAEHNYQFMRTGMAVRRLTPRECERLQGFPDDWTLIPYRGKPAADGPRYKALGNSMAVNVMRWIGERIKLAEEVLL